MSTTNITGTAANETLLGGFGNDSILGLGGNDSIDGQAGSDTIDGGEGNDTLIGNYGDDSLLGAAGDDQLSDDQGSNVLDGGDGSDRLETRSLAGNHTLRGGTGNDNLLATGKTLNLDGGDGNDALNVNGYLNGSYVNAGVATLSGGGGNDSLNVNYFSQATLDGGLGNDNLYAYGSRNVSMAGGAGEDSLNLSYNNNYSYNTDGSGQKPESYVLDGGTDNDVLTASGYSHSGSGQVFITMRGGSGDDSLTLTDDYAGKQSTGTANYGVSAALLEGGDGNDSLSASGALQVTLTGGTGVDRFMLTAQQWYTLKAGNLNVNTESGYVTVQAKPVEITDFVVGSAGDVLDYSDLLRNASLTYNGSNPFSSGFLKLTQQGADTLLQFDEDGSAANAASLTTLAILKNVQATQLIAANFNPNFPPDGSAAAPQPITGTAANETLLGGFGNDSILGLGGNDSIDGQAGSDTIDGGEGNDTLIGNYGDDSLLGAAGDDQLSDDQGSNVLDGGDGSDRLETRSLAGNHTLRGGTGNDNLLATGKTLNLDGGDGNDALNVNGYLNGSYVNAGVATLSGGGGNDSLNVNYFSQATLDGGLGNDNLYAYGSRNVSMAGGAGEDSLNLSYNNNYSYNTDGSGQKPESYVLDGGTDNDVLTASGYSHSGSGQVFITMRGGSGDDSLTLTDDYAGKQSTGTANYGVSAALLEGGDGNDSLSASGALQVTLTGGTGVDRFMLTAQQWYTLKAGNLNVNTESGYVTVQAKPVEITDFVVGSAGDVLDYSDLLRNASLTYNGSNPFSSGFLKLTQQGADTLLQFDEDGSAANAASLTTLAILKNVQATQLIAANFNPNFPPDGSAAAPQPITGTAGADSLIGADGPDTIDGLAGNDTLRGGGGNDILIGGTGADSLDGGEGWDEASYANASAAIVADLSLGTVQDGSGSVDQVVNIEVIGGSAFADIMLGSTRNEGFYGGNGADTIDGGGGSDEVYFTNSSAQNGVTVRLGAWVGSTGVLPASYTGSAIDQWGNIDVFRNIRGVEGSNYNDLLVGDASSNWLDGRGGSDTLDGGAGWDGVEYNQAIGGVVVDLSQGRTFQDGQGLGNAAHDASVEQDVLISIENVAGGPGDDSITGDNGTNQLYGAAGNDTILGLEGNDSIDGGAGNDSLNGGLGGDYFYLGRDDGADTIDGGGYNTRSEWQSYLSVTNGGDYDTLIYRDAPNGTVIDLSARSVSVNGLTGIDRFNFVEEIHGSPGQDVITGRPSEGFTSNPNTGDSFFFWGLGGSDVINQTPYGVGARWSDGLFVGYSWSETGITINWTGNTAQVSYGAGTGSKSGAANTAAYPAGTDTLTNIGYISTSDFDDVVNAQGATLNHHGYLTNPYERISYFIVTARGGNDVIRGNGNFLLIPSVNTSVSAVPANNQGFIVDGRTLDSTGLHSMDLSHLKAAYSSSAAHGVVKFSGVSYVFGTPWNDTVYAGNGIDDFRGQGGNDSFYGNDQVNQSSHRDSDNPITINLANGTVTDGTAANPGGSSNGSDTLRGVEFVDGSRFDDVFDARGFSETSVNAGGVAAGWKGMGNGYRPTGGNDEVLGNSYTRLVFDRAMMGIKADLAAGYVDALTTDPALRSSPDYLYTVGRTTFSGVAGVVGTDFGDWLIGGTNIAKVGTSFHEIFEPRGGADTIDGVFGLDVISYSSSPNPISVDLRLSSGQVINDGWGSTDTIIYRDQQRLRIDASHWDDMLIGESRGSDLQGNRGSDTMIGGDGWDMAYFLSSRLPGSSGVVVNLGGTQVATNTQNAINVAKQNTWPSGYQLATGFTAWAIDNWGSIDLLKGIDGAEGSAWEDLLVGSDADNEFDGREGNDTIDGGGGQDWVEYNNTEGAVVASLEAGEASNDGAGYLDILLNIEHLRGGIFNDSLTGNSGANQIKGEAGEDTLNGQSGNDTLLGGADSDELSGGPGNDMLTGGEGSDRFTWYNFSSGNSATETDTISDFTLGEQLYLSSYYGAPLSIAASGTQASALASGQLLIETINANSLKLSLNRDSIVGIGTDDLVVMINSAQPIAASNFALINGTLYSGASMTPSSGNDTIGGTSGNDTIDALAGNDSVDGGAGNDSLLGNDGQDSLFGGTGNDTLLGGADGDWLNGGEGSDSLDGGTGPDYLNGDGGNDTLLGGADSDELSGGLGNDMLTGGEGSDRFTWYNFSSGNSATETDTISDFTLGEQLYLSSYYGTPLSIAASGTQASALASGQLLIETINANSLKLSLNRDSIVGIGTDDLVVMINSAQPIAASNFALINGTLYSGASMTPSSGNDTIGGTSGNDTIDALAGNDSVDGGAGNDSLLGNDGQDSLFGGTGNDTLLGGADGDWLNGGEGSDSLDGGTGPDYLNGDGGNDTLLGGADSDQLSGGPGNDMLTGGEGSDRFTWYNFSSGNSATETDTISDFTLGEQLYLSSYNGTPLSIAASGTQASALASGQLLIETINANSLKLSLNRDSIVGIGTDDLVVMINSAQPIAASNFALINGALYSGASMTPSSGNDTIGGTSGNDTIDALAGNDSVDGGAGNDSLLGNDGQDSLFGGTGNDTLLGGADGDWLNGGEGSDSLDGGTGPDYLNGDGGNDTLLGGADSDELSGGLGNDMLTGGEGSDRFTWYNFSSGNSATETDTISDFTLGEQLYLSSYYGTPLSIAASGTQASALASGQLLIETINANSLKLSLNRDSIVGIGTDDLVVMINSAQPIAASNFALINGTLYSGASMTPSSGNDTIGGTSGNDTIDALAGNDSVDGGAGNDSLLGNDGQDSLFGGTGSDSLDGGTGPDYLNGDGGNDTLLGGADNDQLSGGEGNDSLDGGAGTDTATFNNNNSSMVIDLAAGTAQGEGNDLLFSIENITLNAYSTFSNQVWGDDSINRLIGGKGNDVLVGRGGDDYLAGGSLTGGKGSGADSLLGGLGNDELLGLDADDTLNGGAGNDTLDGGSGVDTAVFSGPRAAYVISFDQSTSRYQVVSAAEGSDTVLNVERFSFSDGIFDTAQLSTQTLSGMSYHWKSHALLPGVTLTGLDPKAVQTDSSDRFDLRAASLNAATNTLSVELWMNNATQTVSNFDFTAQNSAAVTASFISALDSAEWTVNINGSNSNRVIVAGYMKNDLESVGGSIKLGTMQYTLSAGAPAPVSFTNLKIGKVGLADVQFGLTTATTAANGQFVIAAPASGDQVFSAHRATSDGSIKGGVTAADALAALMIAVELNPNPDPDGTGPNQALKVSPYQVIAADVNQDGEVSSIDAFTILKMAVGRADAPPASWIFVPEQRDFWDDAKQQFTLNRLNANWDPKIVVPATQAQTNLVGLTRGDVNGSWSLAGASTVEASNPSHFQTIATLIGAPLDQWGIAQVSG